MESVELFKKKVLITYSPVDAVSVHPSSNPLYLRSYGTIYFMYIQRKEVNCEKIKSNRADYDCRSSISNNHVKPRRI